ncbi:1-(5-phosphoribosyl)-5-[(5-phosphoribosylamino) methylideneamino] imidazole-4-carboxamide isomerase [Pullulanibacillus camelliae]|uniref:1-(5-phosphoribosyl)-5-[(5-phosphoribosylamino)methylideneamino] imidazole-4-carboxamide isomerase n=1 Tax=Pullulanibacillus camelliae TaxID=1707096 RepID=A0A8J2VW49_9BACL|nr:1-(5-phosphoribosyl)-5-[(5-phosphoribosylamino)methylideneamino]imidazole-4-carboxamide isomerase [Pullulanibacillus camelliae]GGE39912.1 1-(5-phosphoribosyl)-5-[(5-phosphoribosylamino) methylideneamino] imidazole-4-carboxamide isomerase [Pullulanibacillus camelliae]
MKIIPAIDLIEGQCVRLYQGKFDQSTQVANDPEEQLVKFMEDGAKRIHIVDLDGARSGHAEQFELIARLAKKATLPIQVGGGIRSLETIERYLSSGVSQVILGTGALENHAFTKAALSTYKDAIIIGIDALHGQVATKGWETVSTINYIDFAKQMEDLGVQRIIYTDISKDGTMKGPNLEELQALSTAVSATIVASGGITTPDDLRALEEIGIEEAIVGKALYEGRIRLEEAPL